MDDKEIYSNVVKLLVRAFNLTEDQIKPQSNLRDDLGLDSVEFMDSITIFEQHFGTRIIDNEIEENMTIDTVRDLCDLIEKKITRRS